ncbi:MAG: sulfonate ABC transporter substrate-binding protein, partial [Methanomicrobiales archaeon]|nr:sulfonate ABC transporter substrate-binding protein [Methanomicrobiales archaeon]
MRPITTILLAVALVAAFALVAGCTETDDMTHLRIGYQPSTHQIAHFTAMEKGWWQEDLAPFGITKVTDY